MKRVIITHGPGYEPIDQVRRITNFSTGSLGSLLAARFASAGFEVHAFRGELATAPSAPAPVHTIPFSTNADLLAKLEEHGAKGPVGWVFHVAALCDFCVDSVTDENGSALDQAKIPTRDGSISMILKPSIKILPQMRRIFPAARIVGWKYELNGDRNSALEAGRRQLREAGVDACVINGRAWGDGFGFMDAPDSCVHIGNSQALADSLVSWCLSPQYTPSR